MRILKASVAHNSNIQNDLVPESESRGEGGGPRRAVFARWGPEGGVPGGQSLPDGVQKGGPQRAVLARWGPEGGVPGGQSWSDGVQKGGSPAGSLGPMGSRRGVPGGQSWPRGSRRASPPYLEAKPREASRRPRRTPCEYRIAPLPARTPRCENRSRFSRS